MIVIYQLLQFVLLGIEKTYDKVNQNSVDCKYVAENISSINGYKNNTINKDSRLFLVISL